MVAHFGNFYEDATWHFVVSVPSDPSLEAPQNVARLGDLLPQVLARYGYAADAKTPPVGLEVRSSVDCRPETNRPGASQRRRVG